MSTDICYNTWMTMPLKFLQETVDELKKVTWPKQQEVIRLTIVVILVSIMVGLFIGGLDFAFTKIMEVVIK